MGQNHRASLGKKQCLGTNEMKGEIGEAKTNDSIPSLNPHFKLCTSPQPHPPPNPNPLLLNLFQRTIPFTRNSSRNLLLPFDYAFRVSLFILETKQRPTYMLEGREGDTKTKKKGLKEKKNPIKVLRITSMPFCSSVKPSEPISLSNTFFHCSKRACALPRAHFLLKKRIKIQASGVFPFKNPRRS